MDKIVIIGGGASGLTCAIKAKNDNNEVIILERNDACGKKILATGNGKCNYYNENQDISNYNSFNTELISKIINDENISKVKNFFNELGLIPKIKNGYYYPMSEQASSIRNILVNKAKEKDVKIITNCNVIEITKEDNKFVIKTTTHSIICDKVVLSTGSYAGVKNIKDVNSYKILDSFNLMIENVLPTLVQLKGEGQYFRDWDGVRIDSNIKLYEDDKFIKEENGQIQLTSYGVSGICVFNLSSKISRGLSHHKKEELVIDFLPTIDNLDEYFNRRSKILGNYKIIDFLEGLINTKLVHTILSILNIDKNKTYNDLSITEKSKLVNMIKSFKLKITGTNDYTKAQTCTGGLDLEELNLNTMEVIKVPNLYVIGEIIDLDGICGGYNLTIAWLTGIVAGSDLND